MEAYDRKGFQTLIHQSSVETPVLVPRYFPGIILVLASQTGILHFAATEVGQNLFECTAAASLSVKHGDMLKSTHGDVIKSLLYKLQSFTEQRTGQGGRNSFVDTLLTTNKQELTSARLRGFHIAER